MSESIHVSQSFTLKSLYNATGLALTTGMNQSLNWFQGNGDFSTDEYCSYEGVSCDRDGFVLSVDLRAKGLNGTIPPDIGDLVRLRAIRLNDNELHGELPTRMLQMSSLRYLNLGHNLFEGDIPDFSGLPFLNSLILDRNAFSGVIPASLCSLSSLEALDLSACTKLEGSLPACLGNLTELKALRIADIGLTGSIPSTLCNGREMNGFDPNPFGCAAVACDVGFFRRGTGRQMGENSSCSVCTVPSNTLGSTTCQWVSMVGDDGDLDKEGRKGPTVESMLPTLSPSGPPSKFPTNVFHTHAPSIQATIVPSLPTPQPSASIREPTTMQVPTTAPIDPSRSAQPSTDILFDAIEAQSNPSTGGLIGGSVTLGACVLVFLLFILSRHRPPKYFVRADNESLDGCGNAPPVLPTFRPQESLPTIDEEDSGAMSRSGSLETVLPHGMAQPSSPPNLRDAKSAKRVRFVLPSPSEFYLIEAREDSETFSDEFEADAPSDTTSPFGNVDAFATWIMNPPLFDATSFCTAAVKPPVDDERSWHSQDASLASSNSETPILKQPRSAGSTAASSTGVRMRVLGIQRRTSDHGSSVVLSKANQRTTLAAAHTPKSALRRPTTKFWQDTQTVPPGSTGVPAGQDDSARSTSQSRNRAEI
jgi:hypothetical protein